MRAYAHVVIKKDKFLWLNGKRPFLYILHTWSTNIIVLRISLIRFYRILTESGHCLKDLNGSYFSMDPSKNSVYFHFLIKRTENSYFCVKDAKMV